MSLLAWLCVLSCAHDRACWCSVYSRQTQPAARLHTGNPWALLSLAWSSLVLCAWSYGCQVQPHGPPEAQALPCRKQSHTSPEVQVHP